MPASPDTSARHADRLPCTLSLDLDDAWTYLRAAGRPGWETTATVVPRVCERLLDLLRRHRVRFTLFVITRDLEDEAKVAAIRPFVEEGHEIGCHSHWHEPTFATLDKDHLRREIHGAADLIEHKLGVRPTGFRAPGFARNPHTPEVLAEAGFRYDGSFLPTFLGPIARLYYFFQSDMTAEEKKKRAAMFGHWKDVFGHLRARPHAAAPGVLDLPVTTIPLLRSPFHLSYILWLSGKSRWLARRYLGLGLSLCKLRAVPPSYLLHSLDFVGNGEHQDLDFFPGMNVTWAQKSAVIEHLMTQLTRRFAVQPMGPFCERLLPQQALAGVS
ncbi:MAG: polysaccharide deacetylase family protein [Planctomycetota bacterium]